MEKQLLKHDGRVCQSEFTLGLWLEPDCSSLCEWWIEKLVCLQWTGMGILGGEMRCENMAQWASSTKGKTQEVGSASWWPAAHSFWSLGVLAHLLSYTHRVPALQQRSHVSRPNPELSNKRASELSSFTLIPTPLGLASAFSSALGSRFYQSAGRLLRRADGWRLHRATQESSSAGASQLFFSGGHVSSPVKLKAYSSLPAAQGYWKGLCASFPPV